MSERPTASDGEHDAWLREALRHAPDADVAPPPRLSDAILSQARAAVAPPAAPHPLLAFWSWLARPPVAAGFASVMAATLVGMMWWDRPLDEAMPAPAVPSVAQAPAPARPAPAPAPVEAEAQRAKEAATTAMPTPVAPARPPATVGMDRAPAAPAREEKSMAKVVSPDADSPARAPAPLPSPHATEPARDARARNDGVTAFPAEPAPRSRAPAPTVPTAPAAPAAPTVPTAPAATDAAATDAPRDQTLAGSARQAPAPRAAPAGRSETMALRRGSVAPPVVEPLAPLLADLAAEPAGWTQVGADGRVAAVDPALRRWLAELDAATAGRWTALATATEFAAAPSASAATATTLVLRQGERTVATLSLAPGSATFESRLDGAVRTWRAELEPATAERLRQGQGQRQRRQPP